MLSGGRPPATGEGAWSAGSDGMSGRIRVVAEDLRPGRRHAVYMDLRNGAPVARTVTSRPRLHADLRDAAATPVPPADALASGPMPAPHWLVIPAGACLGMRIDMETLGVPAPDEGRALIAVGGVWVVPGGHYVLRVTLDFVFDANGPADQWVGRLEPPPVEVRVMPSP